MIKCIEAIVVAIEIFSPPNLIHSAGGESFFYFLPEAVKHEGLNYKIVSRCRLGKWTRDPSIVVITWCFAMYLLVELCYISIC